LAIIRLAVPEEVSSSFGLVAKKYCRKKNIKIRDWLSLC